VEGFCKHGNEISKFDKVMENSLVAERLAASEEG
jgi:hypothetical protein